MGRLEELECTMNNKIVECPEGREEIVANITYLSDIEYQKRVWLHQDKWEEVGYGNFDLAVHCFFDDRPDLAEDPHSSIGFYLVDANEADAIKFLTVTIDRLLNRYGRSLTDEQYIEKPEWQEVVEAAKAARVAMGV
jgi:hypothetical protein